MPRKRATVRSRPTGSVREVDGKFEARCSIRDMTKASGKAERSQRFPTRVEALAWIAEMHGQTGGGDTIPRARSGMTLEQWITWCYITRPLDTVSPRVLVDDHRILTRYVLNVAPMLARQRLRDIATRDIEALFHLLASRGSGSGNTKPLGRNSLYRVFSCLKARMRDAVRESDRTGLTRNPMPATFNDLRLRVTPPEQLRRLSAQELAAVLAECRSVLHGEIIAFLALTGARPAEAIALRREDVDLDNASAHIRHSLVRICGTRGWSIQPTKTRTARKLELAPSLVSLLREHRAQREESARLLGAEFTDHGFEFCSSFGEPLHVALLSSRTLPEVIGRAACRLLSRPLPPFLPPNNSSPEYRAIRTAYTKLLADARRDADLDFATTYTLRRTAASLLYEASNSLMGVQAVLGHSKASTTDTYIKALSKGNTAGSSAIAAHVAAAQAVPAPVVQPLRLVSNG